MAHYDLGLIAEARGNADRAIEKYTIELRRKDPSYRASFNLAKLLSRAGRHAEALTHFRNAVYRKPAVRKRLTVSGQGVARHRRPASRRARRAHGFGIDPRPRRGTSGALRPRRHLRA